MMFQLGIARVALQSDNPIPLSLRKSSSSGLYSRSALAVMSLALLWSNAFAQSPVPAGINSPVYSLTDENGVNLTSNKPSAHVDDVRIGSAQHPFTHSVETAYEEPTFGGISFVDTYTGRLDSSYMFNPSPNCAGTDPRLDVFLAGHSDRMCGNAAGTYWPQRGTGTSMVTNADGTRTYFLKDGTQYLFGGTSVPNSLLTRITAPDGRVSTLTYRATTSMGPTHRLQSVTRNDGLQLKYAYVRNAEPTTTAELMLWRRVASVTALNNAVDYCDPQADTCTYSQPWPVASQTWTTSGSVTYFTVTDAGGQSTRFTLGLPAITCGVCVNGPPVAYTTNQLLAIRAPTSTSADTVTYAYCAFANEFYCMHQGVEAVTIDGVNWAYTGTSASGGGNALIIVLTAAKPGGGSRITTSQTNPAQGPLMSYGDGIGLATYYFESTIANRLSYVVRGDGDKLTYDYDGRANIIRETHTPASGSPLAATVRTANYDTTCANPLTCNSPNWIRDAKQNQTDYTYEPDHGGVRTITSPPDTAGIRPQVRYTYTPKYAWFKNASGVMSQAATPIWTLTTERFCRRTAALENGSGCTDPLDEVVTTYDYGSSGVANNLFVRGKAVTADGVTHRTCYANDVYGNQISETSPNAGLASCP